jgi:hypothetical protein
VRLVWVNKDAGPGVVGFNFMWAPTFIGMSGPLKTQLEKKLAPELVGKPLTDETLDWAHGRVVDFLVEMFPTIKGLRDYLDAIKFVEEDGK